MSALLWPAMFAGLVAVGATVAIERLGGRAGGLVATLPSTIVPASLGIGAAGDEALRAAMELTPPGMLVNVLFLWAWRVLPPRVRVEHLGGRLAVVTAASLTLWGVAAVALVLGARAWRAAGLPTLALGLLGAAVLLGVGLLACRAGRPAPSGRRPVGPATLLARGIFAALAIGVAVAIARAGDGIAAGVAAVFPAIFLTTMLSVWLSQGRAVQMGAVGPMMLGSTSVAAYALLARFTLPALGPGPGAALAWLGAVIGATVPLWLWLRRRPLQGA